METEQVNAGEQGSPRRDEPAPQNEGNGDFDRII